MLQSVDVFDGLDGQHFDFRADGAAPDAGQTIIEISGGPHGPTATIPNAHLLFNAEFKRAGSDLVLNGDDGKTATVHDYFASDKRPMLLSPDGAALTPAVVAALAGPLATGQYAQATPAQANAEAVGRVATVSGNATIMRNGVAITITSGDAVLKGDVLQTGTGTMGVTFNDGSTLSLTANSRLVVNEFVFDPNGHANSEILSLVQGSLAMISGQVAHTGDMKVVTPVATMGIRGTVFGANINAVNGTTSFYVSQSSTGVDLFDTVTNTLLAHIVQDGPILVVHPVGPAQVLAEEVSKTSTDLATELSELQHIINIKAIGDQLIHQFFQQNNPQSTDHPHTQIQFDTNPNGHQGDSNTGDTGNSGSADNPLFHITTTTINATSNTVEEPLTTFIAPVPTNLPPINFAPLQQTAVENHALVFDNAHTNTISVFDRDTSTLTVMLTAAHGTFSLNGISGLNFAVGDGLHDATMTFSGSQTDINAALNGLTFDPELNFLGPASLTIQTSDGGNNTGPTTVAINVGPVAVDDNIITNVGFGTLFQIPNSALLANDVDPIHALTLTQVGNAHNAIVGLSGDHVNFLPLGPSGQFNGGTFDYTISDGVMPYTAHVTVLADTQGELDGTPGNDILIGNAAGSTINGNGGNDILIGGAAADTLNAGTGNNTLTGGNGPDTFVFNQVPSNNVVTDYHPDQDFLNIDHALFTNVTNAAELLAHAQDNGVDTVITADNAPNTTITLDHVTVADLTAHLNHILIA